MFALAFGLLLAPGSAIAITLPDCAALAAWTEGTDLREYQVLNPSTTLGFPTAFLGAEFAALYGKTGPEFTLDEVAQARQGAKDCRGQVGKAEAKRLARSEEHTSELQSLMRIPYAVFCLKQKKTRVIH